MGTELDVLALGNYLLLKEEQDISFQEDYKEKYELD
jgi:carbamoyltransferase